MTNPYPEIVPEPYDPDSHDAEMGPDDYSPPGPPLLTPDEAIALAPGVSDPDATVTP